jgi:hypothetical protein
MMTGSRGFSTCRGDVCCILSTSTSYCNQPSRWSRLASHWSTRVSADTASCIMKSTRDIHQHAGALQLVYSCDRSGFQSTSCTPNAHQALTVTAACWMPSSLPLLPTSLSTGDTEARPRPPVASALARPDPAPVSMTITRTAQAALQLGMGGFSY